MSHNHGSLQSHPKTQYGWFQTCAKVTLQYMFDEEMHGTRNSQGMGTKEEVNGPKDVISEHNRFLDDYFESIDPKMNAH